jgi:hypothetical protein
MSVGTPIGTGLYDFGMYFAGDGEATPPVPSALFSGQIQGGNDAIVQDLVDFLAANTPPGWTIGTVEAAVKHLIAPISPTS